MRYQNQLIKCLDYDRNPILIDAKVREIFAIHENLDRFLVPAKRTQEPLKHPYERVFTVTHLPTGCALLTSSVGKCQMFVNKVKNLSWHLITGKEGNRRIPEGFEKDLYTSYCREFSL